MKKCLLFLTLTLLGLEPCMGQGGTASGFPQQMPRQPFSIDTSNLGNMPTAAQDRSPIKFRTRTEYVLVPVLVKDKSKHHISGLTKADFLVRENGKPRQLVAVDEYQANARPLQKPAVQPIETTNRLDDSRAQKNLTIIAFDLVNTAFQDQGRARQMVVDFLKKVPSAGSLYEVLLFTRRGVIVLHDFSMDTASLTKAVMTLHGEVPGERMTDRSRQEVLEMSNSQAALYFVQRGTIADLDQYFRSLYAEDVKYQQADAIRLTLGAFEYVAGATAGLPGRKSLLWVTGGFPFYIDSNSQGLARASDLLVSESVNRQYLPAGIGAQLYERTIQMLNQANVAIYPVDARGLVTVGLQDASVKWTTNNTTLAPQFDVMAIASRQVSSTITTMKQLAEMTGGNAYYNTNDIERSLQEAAADASSYYILSFKPDTKDRRPGWRKIEVKVARPGVQVRARSGYFLTQTTNDPTSTRKMDITAALSSPLDFTALAATVRWTGISDNAGKRKVNFEIDLGPDSATIDEASGKKIYVDFAALTKNGKGEPVAETSRSYTIQLKPEAVDQIRVFGITYRNVLEVPDGEYMVTFVVRDNLSGRLGSVIVPLNTHQLAAALEPALAVRPRPQ